MVVPNGTLFGDGVCARIKEELLKEFNLHTIVRLPNGVFAPYTGIPTNLLFFDRSGPTREVWYYEQPLPEGRKNYTKTAPIQFEEFAPLVSWWNKRKENDHAWKVPAAELLAELAATSTARIRAPRKTSRTCRRRNWPKASLIKSGESRTSWGTSKACWPGQNERTYISRRRGAEGGFTARALGQSIFTEAETLEKLRQQVRDAVQCHFDEGKAPKVIRLHFVREEVLAG